MKVLVRHIAWIASVALVSCSASDPVDPTPQPPQQLMPISIVGGLQSERQETRAGERGLEEVLTGEKKFKLFGYKNDAFEAPNYTSYQVVMPNFDVCWIANSAYTTNSNTNDWEYVGQGNTPEQRAEQTIKYWDFGAKAYRFFGYAMGNATASPATSPAAVSVPGGYPTGTSTTATSVAFSSTVDASSEATIAAAPYFSQLWFSDGNPANYPDRIFGQPVQLKFLKPFARVRFMFTFVNDLSFGREKLSNIRFYPTRPLGASTTPVINTAGTVTVTYPLKGTETVETWTTSAVTASLPAFAIDYYETPSPMPAGHPVDGQSTTWPNSPQKWYTVLPNTAQGSYTLEVAVVSNEIKTAIVPAEYMQWKPGYQYTYKFKITETGGITMDIIQVAINDWTNRQSSQHTVYNW